MDADLYADLYANRYADVDEYPNHHTDADVYRYSNSHPNSYADPASSRCDLYAHDSANADRGSADSGER